VLHQEGSSPFPSAGSSVQLLKQNTEKFYFWEVTGIDRIRRVRRQYSKVADALIFVVDSYDIERMQDAAAEMYSFLESDTTRHLSHVLVFANKQDLPGALKVTEVVDKMGLVRHQSMVDRRWYMQV